MKLSRFAIAVTPLLMAVCAGYSSPGLARPSAAFPDQGMAASSGAETVLEREFKDIPPLDLSAVAEPGAEPPATVDASAQPPPVPTEKAQGEDAGVAWTAAGATESLNVWQRLIRGMKLPRSLTNPLVRKYLNAFRGNQRYFDSVMPQMALYLPHILTELEERDAPLELAFLPLIESGYNPAARAPSGGIAGMWQFTRGTGDALGIPRNSWYDGRFDAIVSTRTAADYLTDLQENFAGDWLLAIAAYNCGARTVSDALVRGRQQGKKGDFWSLQLNGRARDYVPELLALAEIFRHPERYDIELPVFADEPLLEAVTIDQPLSLKQAAELADIEVNTLRRLNPAYLRGVIPAAGTYQLLLPTGTRNLFELALAASTPESLRIAAADIAPATSVISKDRSNLEYRVKRGDTLSTIAHRHRVSVADVKVRNQLAADFLPVGKVLKIPGSPASHTR